MVLNEKFAVRGLLAFLAFMEAVNCCRSLLPSLFTLPHEKLSETFIQNKIFNLVDLSSDSQQLVGSLFGYLSLINAVVLVHSALYLHHPHIISLTSLILIIKTVFLISIKTSTNSLTIPLILTVSTLLGVLILAWKQYKEDSLSWLGAGNENEMLLRAMKKSVKSKKVNKSD